MSIRLRALSDIVRFIRFEILELEYVYGILTKLEQIAITSLIFSLIAMGLSLVRILKSRKVNVRERLIFFQLKLTLNGDL